MPYFISLVLILISPLALSAGTVDFLEVDNDVVLFSTTEAKTHTLPSCVTAENSNLWSVSLATDSGRATYSLILTAMAKGDSVGLSIQSADNCADKTGVESASKVNVVVNVEPIQLNSDSTKSVGVYDSEDNRLGTLINYNSEYDFEFTDQTGNVLRFNHIESGRWGHPVMISVFYAEENCQGTGYFPGHQVNDIRSPGAFYNPYHLEKKYLVAGRYHGEKTSLSYRNNSNPEICKNSSGRLTFYELNVSTNEGTRHPQCGLGMCKIKQD